MADIVDRQSYPRRLLGSISCSANERVLYECPAGKSTEIRHLRITSTHTGSETIRLHHCRQDEATSIHNALYYDFSISAKSYVSDDNVIYLNQGERLICSAPASDRITVTAYGVET